MRRPPIDGVPVVRPACPACQKPLKPFVKNEYRVFVRWRSYADLFCTLRCALTFATLAHQAGYRLSRNLR